MEVYLAALCGSAAAELATALKESLALDGRCPPRYRRAFYVLARLAFAVLVAAPMPFLLDVTNAYAAFYIGVSAPVIIDRLVSADPGSIARPPRIAADTRADE